MASMNTDDESIAEKLTTIKSHLLDSLESIKVIEVVGTTLIATVPNPGVELSDIDLITGLEANLHRLLHACTRVNFISDSEISIHIYVGSRTKRQYECLAR